MKKNKKMKKIFKVLIFLFMIVLIILMIALIKLKNNTDDIQYTPEQEEAAIKEYISDKVIPQGISKFIYNYKGTVPRDDFYKHLHIVSQYLLDLSKALEKTSVLNYYNKNSVTINEYLGIDNKEDFEKLSNYLMQYELSNSTFQYCIYNDTTLKDNGNYWKFSMDFQYENCESIKLDIQLLDKKMSNKSLLIVSVPNN